MSRLMKAVRLLMDERETKTATAESEIPHYVQSYTSMVASFKETMPLDEAMSKSVGGHYEVAGAGLAQALISLGLSSGKTLVDIGCGSGRVATQLGKLVPDIDYLGTDIVPDLLEYAREKSPPHFKFMLHREISVPAPDNSADIVCFYSVLTHLFHQESYVYLLDAKRALKPGGVISLTFLESAGRWALFEQMTKTYKEALSPHLNMFIERPMLEAWAEHLGMRLEIGPTPKNGQTGARLYKAS